jgi:hypothetical protein
MCKVLARFIVLVPFLVSAACSNSAGPSPEAPGPTPDVVQPDPGENAPRAELTAAECEGQGAEVVGDIGDGAIHRPDYRCPSGAAPVGSIGASAGEPIAVEGAVCCPK